MMKLVEDWRRAWTWFSVQAMTLSTALLGAWMWMPDSLKQMIPEKVVLSVAIALLVLGTAGRLMQQGGKTAAEETAENKEPSNV